ncbi:MAG: TonB-dependent receptor domain-containing protein [Opitutaceae bacterium]
MASFFFTAETTRSNRPERVGARLPYTPRNTFFAWSRYTVLAGALRGFGFGVGLRHNDAARISNDPNNVVENLAFTVCDAVITHDLDFARSGARLQLNIKNVFDKLHREGPDGFFNTRRQIFLSVRTNF